MPPEPLPHLETFALAAELGGFTAAARALGLTQAAVSQRVQQLEAVLVAPLFRRKSGRVELTASGRLLYDYAGRIGELHREARAAVTGQSGAPDGELTVAASSVPGEHFLLPLLSAYRDRHPKVRVRATVADTCAAHREVEAGRAHVGLVGGRTDGSHFEYTHIGRDRLVLVVPPAHPWRRRKRVSADDLLRQPLVQRERGSGSRACLERALAAAGRTTAPANVALELGSNEAVKDAVSRGFGVAVLSRLAVADDVKSGRLHSIDVAGLSLDRDFWAVRDRRRATPGPARLLLTMLECRPDLIGA